MVGWDLSLPLTHWVTLTYFKRCLLYSYVPSLSRRDQSLASATQAGTLVVCPIPPPLAIAPAVLLSWPSEDDGWTVETATSMNGPWAASDATPFTQYGRHSIAVPTDDEHRFFRLR